MERSTSLGSPCRVLAAAWGSIGRIALAAGLRAWRKSGRAGGPIDAIDACRTDAGQQLVPSLRRGRAPSRLRLAGTLHCYPHLSPAPAAPRRRRDTCRRAKDDADDAVEDLIRPVPARCGRTPAQAEAALVEETVLDDESAANYADELGLADAVLEERRKEARKLRRGDAEQKPEDKMQVAQARLLHAPEEDDNPGGASSGAALGARARQCVWRAGAALRAHGGEDGRPRAAKRRGGR